MGDGYAQPWHSYAMDDNPASHFGRQVKKERLAHSLSLPELAKVTGIDGGHWSRIENGKRPPTEKIALACDRAIQDGLPQLHGMD